MVAQYLEGHSIQGADASIKIYDQLLLIPNDFKAATL